MDESWKAVMEMAMQGNKGELAKRIETLGAEHPDVAESLITRAHFLETLDNYPEAILLYSRGLGILEKALGPEDAKVVECLQDMAYCFMTQKLYKKAESLLQRILMITEKNSGPEHKDTADCLRRLADIYYQQGLYGEGKPLLERAIPIFEKQEGIENTTLALYLIQLSSCCQSAGLSEQAESSRNRAHMILLKNDSSDGCSGYIANLMNMLATLYKVQGLYAQAETLYKRELEIYETLNKKGRGKYDVALGLCDVAELYCDQKMFPQADPFYQRAQFMLKDIQNVHPRLMRELYGRVDVLSQKLGPGKKSDDSLQSRPIPQSTPEVSASRGGTGCVIPFAFIGMVLVFSAIIMEVASKRLS